MIQVRPSTHYRDLHGEGVLLQLERGEYFSIEGVAYRAWQLLASTGDWDRTLAALSSEYDVSGDVLAGDLRTFVDELQFHHLVDIIGDPGPGR